MFQIILKRLKDLQGENSVSAFARFLEMPQKTVDTYINGQRKPSVEFIMRVCSKCHVTSDWLLGLTNERERADQFGTVPKREEKFQIFSKETNKHLGSVKQSEISKIPRELSVILSKIEQRITLLESRIASQSQSACCG